MEEAILITKEMYDRALHEAMEGFTKEAEGKTDTMGILLGTMMGMRFAIKMRETLFEKEKYHKPPKDEPMDFDEAAKLVNDALGSI